MKLNLVDEWRDSWRWFSVNCMVIAGALQGAWIYVPEDLRSSVPPHLVNTITLGLLLTGIVGRLVKQEKNNVALADKKILERSGHGRRGGACVAKRPSQRNYGVPAKKPKRKN